MATALAVATDGVSAALFCRLRVAATAALVPEVLLMVLLRRVEHFGGTQLGEERRSAAQLGLDLAEDLLGLLLLGLVVIVDAAKILSVALFCNECVCVCARVCVCVWVGVGVCVCVCVCLPSGR